MQQLFSRKTTLLWSLLVVLSAACSTDFDLEAEWKDIPVVYGFLSKQDSAHYIRVEKAFLQLGGDATQIAQIADSLYYDDKVKVQLQRLSNGQFFDLTKVDGSLEGYPRQGGPFAQVPNYLYKIKASNILLKEGEKIRLLINRGEDKAPVTAETTVLGNMTPRESNPASPVNWGYDRTVNFGWGADLNTQIFDLRLVIYYKESVPGDPAVLTDKSITWVLKEDILRDSEEERMSFGVQGEDLYKFLGQNLPPVSDRIRIFDHMDVYISGSGQELVDLLRVTRANVGITSSQEVPVYSNLSEGRGIFTSRTQAIRFGLQMTNTSLDSLRNGIHTRDLNFR